MVRGGCFFVLLVVCLISLSVCDVTLYTLSFGEPNLVNVFSGSDPSKLSFVLSASTGADGLNSTDPTLQSQNPIFVYLNYLFAVNPESNKLSLFYIPPEKPTQIVLVDVQDTGFDWPNSVTASGVVACVVGTGENSGFRCYTFNQTGLYVQYQLDRPFVGFNLTTPPQSHTGPAQISFTPDASGLVISLKSSGPPLLLYPWTPAGLAEVPIKTNFPGGVPFGFTFFANVSSLVLTNAAPTGTFGGVVLTSVITFGLPSIIFETPYYLLQDQIASCWISWSSETGNFYVANAGSTTISEVALTDSGDALVLVENIEVGSTGLTNNIVVNVNGNDYLWQYAGGKIITVDIGSNTVLQTFDSNNGPRGDGVAIYVS